MNTNKQRIVFMGTPQCAADILAGLFADGYDIVTVVFQPEREVGV
jgi:methionyl-tRNA formyltransferase